MDQLDESAVAINQRADRRTVKATSNGVSFPVTDPQAFLHDGRALIDQRARNREARSALAGTPTAFAKRSSGTESSGELPAQTAQATVIKPLVDRLVAHVPIRPVGVFIPKPSADLLRAPLQLKFGFAPLGTTRRR